MSELKKTIKETVGFWRYVRGLCSLGVFGSVPLYLWVAPVVGFFVLLTSAVIASILTGREYYIDSMYRIQAISALRERLLTYGDNEYVLETIRDAQIWRGEAVDPSVLARLEDYKKRREELEAKIMEFARQWVGPNHEEKPSN